MPKVICTRPNASLNINGVKFAPTEDGTGVISEEISEEAAELFLLVPGYHQADEGGKQASAPAKAPAPAKPAAGSTNPAAAKKAGKAAPAPAPVAASAPSAKATAASDAAQAATEGNAAIATPAESQAAAPGADAGGASEDPNVF